MTYSFECQACKTTFDLQLTIDDRDRPLSKPCPVCKKKKVKRVLSALPLIYNPGSIFKKTDNGWKDVQKKIIATSGRNHTIRTK